MNQQECHAGRGVRNNHGQVDDCFEQAFPAERAPGKQIGQWHTCCQCQGGGDGCRTECQSDGVQYFRISEGTQESGRGRRKNGADQRQDHEQDQQASAQGKQEIKKQVLSVHGVCAGTQSACNAAGIFP